MTLVHQTKRGKQVFFTCIHIFWWLISWRSGKSDDGPKEDLNGKLLDMYSSIYTMRQDLERIKKPQGSKENPVRSCKDLYFGHPQFKDGM